VVNGLVLVTAAAAASFLLRPRLRRSERWRATVTPLASIIGSGFLVVAPLMAFAAGRLAVVAMAAVVGVAFLVGGAVRYNIIHVEPLTGTEAEAGDGYTALVWMERTARVALSFAYVVAVAFYLELLGAFALRPFDIQGGPGQKWIATGLLVLIGVVGATGGLKRLEVLEEYAVSVKLAVIAGLLAGLLLANVEALAGGSWSVPVLDTSWDFRTVRQILGAFLIVQGFETSRYLSDEYEPELRVRSMRWAQWTAAAIYVVFVGLSMIFFDVFREISETGIIDLSERVAAVLPVLLVVGAVMAQMSAAVADTLGSGGLVEEATRGRVPPRAVYVAAVTLAGALLWVAPILDVIAYASRAFAFYYAIQCAMAALSAWSDGRAGDGSGRRPGLAALYAGLTVLMLATAAFGIPVESSGGGGG
jgi:hypothetical protein